MPDLLTNKLLVVPTMSTRRSTPTCGRSFTRRRTRSSPPTMISLRSHLCRSSCFPSKDVFDPDSPVVFKHNASVSVVRLEIVRVAFCWSQLQSFFNNRVLETSLVVFDVLTVMFSWSRLSGKKILNSHSVKASMSKNDQEVRNCSYVVSSRHTIGRGMGQTLPPFRNARILKAPGHYAPP